jgi:hypothetical protein
MFRYSPKPVPALVFALAFLGTPALAADSKTPAPQPGTLHVLAVGVARAGVNKPEARLPGADRGAAAVAAFFRGQEGKLYQEVRDVTLTNEEATRDGILGQLDCLREEFRPGDMAVVYISAHGGESRGHWFMAAYDHPWNNWSTAGTVKEKEIRERLEKLPGKVIVILDSCHSGAFGDGVSNRDVKAGAGLVVYAAALSDQFSWSNPFLGRGFFTYALLEALEGKADANGDGVVTLAEVDAYVAARVADLTPWSKKETAARGLPAKDQTPTMSRPTTIPGNVPLAVVR